MNHEPDNCAVPPPFDAQLAEARRKLENEMLDDRDLLLLAAREIARTFTYREKKYL